MNNTSTQVDIPRLLNEQPFSAYQWLVFWLCFLVVLFDGFDTAAIGYIAPSLMAEWNVGKPDLGPVLSAALIAVLFPLGGVGSIFFGWLMDRFNANRVLAVGFAITAVAVFAIGQVGNTVGVLVVVVFAAGAIMNTSQSSLPSLAAGFYPTEGRATGVAWMLGAGRFGGIVGSLLVGELMRRQFGFSEIFTILAVPGLLAATALLVKQGAHPETSAEHGATIIEAHVHAEELNNV